MDTKSTKGKQSSPFSETQIPAGEILNSQNHPKKMGGKLKKQYLREQNRQVDNSDKTSG